MPFAIASVNMHYMQGIIYVFVSKPHDMNLEKQKILTNNIYSKLYYIWL